MHAYRHTHTHTYKQTHTPHRHTTNSHAEIVGVTDTDVMRRMKRNTIRSFPIQAIYAVTYTLFSFASSQLNEWPNTDLKQNRSEEACIAYIAMLYTLHGLNVACVITIHTRFPIQYNSTLRTVRQNNSQSRSRSKRQRQQAWQSDSSMFR